MTIIVCSLARVPNVAREHKPSHIISLLDPGTPFPVVRTVANRHLRLEVHDIEVDSEDTPAPNAEHIDSILSFVSAWDRTSPLLVHCYAGISRSTATAFITACALNPQTPELEIAQRLRSASDMASPNQRLVQLADDKLGRARRMCRALTAIGRGGPWLGRDNDAFTIPSRYGP